jgi:predicted acetyltransferase
MVRHRALWHDSRFSYGDFQMSEPGTITITRVGPEANTIVTNLFEHYLHDMAEWFLFDTDADGRYHYDMARHWARGDRVYLARVDGALVGPAPDWLEDPTARDVEEFFVVRRHRHAGVADLLARTIWDAERGRWRVRVFEGNVPAVPFWRRIVGAYSERSHTEERRFNNDRHWVVFGFSN